MIQSGFRDATVIGAVIKLTGDSLIEKINHIPAVQEKGPVVLEKIILAGQIAYSDAYKYVYFVSIAFGVVSIAAAAFLGDIDQFMVCFHQLSWLGTKTDANFVCRMIMLLLLFTEDGTDTGLAMDWKISSSRTVVGLDCLGHSNTTNVFLWSSRIS